jgi:arabinogalactan oligomer/maltooligosaccharide transport system permease protein
MHCLAVRSLALFVGLLSLLLAAGCDARRGDELVLWHAYRGSEAEALRQVIEAFEREHPGEKVQLLSVPNEAYSNKITAAVPRGNGPDAFIYAHELIGDWSRSDILLSNDEILSPADESPFSASALDALRFDGRTFGLPLSTKTLALYIRTDRLAELGATPPADTEEMIRLARQFTRRPEGRFGLAYEASDFYFHSAWLFGFGGAIFDANGTPRLFRPENVASYEFASRLVNQERIVPAEPSGALVLDLFQSGRALFAISGPWLAADLAPGTPYVVTPLPTVTATGRPARPFMTVEAVLATRQVEGPRRPRVAELMRFLAGPESSRIRARVGHQTVVNPAAFDDPDIANNAFLRTFAEAARVAEPMPNRPEMRTVWEPGNASLRQVLRGTRSAGDALRDADGRLERVLGPAPTAASPAPYLAAAVLALLGAVFWALRVYRRDQLGARARETWFAYLYVLPSAAALLLLVFVPFAVGSALSLYAHRYGEFTFVGLANFVRILSSADYAITDPYSFYFTLIVTVLWTVVNVALHVGIGLALALALRDPWVKLKGFYRVLLIIPWAIPNYITALIWKGMFHVEFGAINKVLALAGVQPVDWFSQFSTAFAANVTTNTWLGFPFMMVVSLGALQSIPRDLDEAAEVDGASRWQRFRHVTLPLLRPALVPSIILGAVWTFNMFNVIYLVSGGEPDGSTEILISEAYRWAFSRQYQYGYAAAYGVLIFLLLLAYTQLTRTKQQATP